MAAPRAGGMGMGLCFYDIISLSITRIRDGGYLDWHRMGRLLRHCFFFFTISLSQTHRQPLIKVHAGQGWNTTLDFPPD